MFIWTLSSFLISTTWSRMWLNEMYNLLVIVAVKQLRVWNSTCKEARDEAQTWFSFLFLVCLFVHLFIYMPTHLSLMTWTGTFFPTPKSIFNLSVDHSSYISFSSLSCLTFVFIIISSLFSHYYFFSISSQVLFEKKQNKSNIIVGVLLVWLILSWRITKFPMLAGKAQRTSVK